MATLDEPTRAEIAVLSAAVEARLTRHPRDTLAALDEPRHALLARLLGFAPARPVPVVAVVGDSHALFFAGGAQLRQVRYRRVGLLRPRYATRGVEVLPCFRVFSIGPTA